MANDQSRSRRRWRQRAVLIEALWLTAAGELGLERRAFPGPLEGGVTGIVEESEMLGQEAFLTCLLRLVERSRFGTADREAAAWLIRDPSPGTDACLVWPQRGGVADARWFGPVPPGVVAQVHTHPTRAASGRAWGSQPSPADCRAAKSLGVPVVVATPTGVFAGLADGRVIRMYGPGWLGLARLRVAHDATVGVQ